MSLKEANYNITKGPQPQNNRSILTTRKAKNKTIIGRSSHPRKLNEEKKPTRKYTIDFYKTPIRRLSTVFLKIIR